MRVVGEEPLNDAVIGTVPQAMISRGLNRMPTDMPEADLAGLKAAALPTTPFGASVRVGGYTPKWNPRKPVGRPVVMISPSPRTTFSASTFSRMVP